MSEAAGLAPARQTTARETCNAECDIVRVYATTETAQACSRSRASVSSCCCVSRVSTYYYLSASMCCRRAPQYSTPVVSVCFTVASQYPTAVVPAYIPVLPCIEPQYASVEPVVSPSCASNVLRKVSVGLAVYCDVHRVAQVFVVHDPSDVEPITSYTSYIHALVQSERLSQCANPGAENPCVGGGERMGRQARTKQQHAVAVYYRH